MKMINGHKLTPAQVTVYTQLEAGFTVRPLSKGLHKGFNGPTRNAVVYGPDGREWGRTGLQTLITLEQLGLAVCNEEGTYTKVVKTDEADPAR